MMRTSAAILVAAVSIAAPAGAAMPVPPSQEAPAGTSGPWAFELLYDLGSKTRYDTGLGGYGAIDLEVKRETTFVRASRGDFFLSAGWILDTEIAPRAEGYYPMPLERSVAYGYPAYERPDNPRGDGFVLSGGLRGRVWKRDSFALHGYGELSLRRESLDADATYASYPPVCLEDGGIATPDALPPACPVPEPITVTETYDIRLNSAELAAGLLAAWTGRRYTVYGGVELAAYSDVEADIEVTTSDGANTATSSNTSDVDRDKAVSFLLGLRADLGPWFIVVETHSVAETVLRVGAGVQF